MEIQHTVKQGFASGSDTGAPFIPGGGSFLSAAVPFQRTLDGRGSAVRKPMFSPGTSIGDYTVEQCLPDKNGTSFLLSCGNFSESVEYFVLKLYEGVRDPEKFRQHFLSLPKGSGIMPEIIECGIYQDRYFGVISEYEPLPSLARLISAKAPMDEHRSIFIVYAVTDLLRQHQKDFPFHGRLKPSKILFSFKQTPKIIGFGTTEFFRKNAPEILANETLCYASPEYISGEELSWQSDMYSLGIIFYRLLTGVLPFYSPDREKLAKSHLEQPLPQPDSRNAAVRVSPAVTAILNRMTMKAPDQRYRSWKLLQEDLIKADSPKS